MDNFTDRNIEEIYNKNLLVLSQRFPELAKKLESVSVSKFQYEIKNTTEGIVLYVNGQCLDHPNKPLAAGDAWIKREIRNQEIKEADNIIVFDFGSGYHIESCLRLTNKPISVVLLDLFLFKLVLEKRDLSEVLKKIKSFVSLEDDNLIEGAELIVRPQMQVVASDAVFELKKKIHVSYGLKKIHPRVAVLGPIRGGTLPIMFYVARAVNELGERVRMIDMSDFDGGFQAASDMFKNRFFKNDAQKQYVELLSKYICRSVLEKPVDIFICLSCAPITVETLVEFRKRGIVTVFWFVEDYLRFDSWKSLAPFFDYIFTIQRGECIEQIKKAGCQNVFYLPTACDPFVHKSVKLTEEERARWGSSISFVGAGYHNRRQTFASFANMPFKIWGTEWPTDIPFDRLVQENGRRLTPEEYIKIFNATDININLHSSTEYDGVEPNGDFLNPRTFELAACGAFQIVDYRSLLSEVFEPDKDIVVFHDIQELKEKVEYYLKHDGERLKYINRCKEIVLSKHTYQDRMKEMFSIIFSNSYEQLKQHIKGDSWQIILENSKKCRDPKLYEVCYRAYQRGVEASIDGIASDIISEKGALSETEEKLLFLYHVSSQMITSAVENQELYDGKKISYVITARDEK